MENLNLTCPAGVFNMVLSFTVRRVKKKIQTLYDTTHKENQKVY